MQYHSAATAPSRANLVGGFLLIAAGLLVGSFMGAAHDVAWVKEWLSWPPFRRNQVMYAHGHLAMLGLTNVALGLTMPHLALRRLQTVVSWSALAAGVLVPVGMLLALLPEPWSRLIYLQAVGFLLLLAATLVAAWAATRSPAEDGLGDPP